MNLLNKNVKALVLSTNDNWKMCCVTEYTEDNIWHSGMNFITSVEDALKTAEEHGLNIIFEKMLRGKSEDNNG